MLGIVADDLTGAIDAAAPFATLGVSTGVFLSPHGTLDSPEWDVVSVNTQTRNLAGPEVETEVRSAVRKLVSAGHGRVFKKIDSTLRGHPGPEIAAAMAEAEAPYVFVAPSFPETGRTVRDGVLYIDGRPVRDAVEKGAAPGSAGTSSVVKLLAEQTGRRTGLVDLATVEAGASAIRNRIGKLISAGITILVFDAVERSHLQRIVSAVIEAYPDGLLAGSAGLSSALAQELSPNPTAVADSGGAAREDPVLVVAGSVNTVTLAQLDRLVNMAGVNTIRVDGAPAAESADKADAELRRTLRGVASTFGRGRDVVIRWTPETERLLASTQAPMLMKTGDLLSGFLQHLSGEIFAESRPGALVLTGGETAYAILSGLGAQGVVLRTELQPGIVLGTAAGGHANGTAVVTKAGGFGDEQALVTAIEHFNRNASTPS